MSIPSATIIGGLSSAFGRNEADFYPTPPECVDALLSIWPVAGTVWEPACGDGAICRRLAHHGVASVGSDLHDRGYGEGGVDLLAERAPLGDAIVTNPPFNIAADFIRRSASFGQPFAMLLKATFWHAARRRELFASTGPEVVAAMLWRPPFDLRRGKSPTMDVIWTIWGAAPAPSCRYVLLPKPRSVLRGDIFE